MHVNVIFHIVQFAICFTAVIALKELVWSTCAQVILQLLPEAQVIPVSFEFEIVVVDFHSRRDLLREFVS